jgi:hypothetical protein
MHDRSASRNYSPERDEFRRAYEDHRTWGLTRRYAEKQRRLDAADNSRPKAATAAGHADKDAHRPPTRPIPHRPSPASSSNPGPPAPPSRSRPPGRNQSPSRRRPPGAGLPPSDEWPPRRRRSLSPRQPSSREQPPSSRRRPARGYRPASDRHPASSRCPARSDQTLRRRQGLPERTPTSGCVGAELVRGRAWNVGRTAMAMRLLCKLGGWSTSSCQRGLWRKGRAEREIRVVSFDFGKCERERDRNRWPWARSSADRGGKGLGGVGRVEAATVVVLKLLLAPGLVVDLGPARIVLSAAAGLVVVLVAVEVAGRLLPRRENQDRRPKPWPSVVATAGVRPMAAAASRYARAKWPGGPRPRVAGPCVSDGPGRSSAACPAGPAVSPSAAGD